MTDPTRQRYLMPLMPCSVCAHATAMVIVADSGRKLTVRCNACAKTISLRKERRDEFSKRPR
jgi:hypothetical protein